MRTSGVCVVALFVPVGAQVQGLQLLGRVLEALGDGAQADITANADRMAATLSECIGAQLVTLYTNETVISRVITCHR